MRINISREWIEKMAALEEGHEIGAGSLSALPRRSGRVADSTRIASMKTLTERIQEYADRKGVTLLDAHTTLLTFALDTLDGRRKGGQKTGNRPQQEKHLAKARKIRAK